MTGALCHIKRAMRGLFSLLFLAGMLVCMGCPSKVVIIPKGQAGKQVQTLELQNARRRAKRVKVRSHSNSARAYSHYLRGRLLALEGKHTQATRYFKMALVYDPTSAFLFFCIARQHYRKKSWRHTVFWAKRSLKQNKHYAPALHLLGLAYWKQRRVHHAPRSLKAAVQYAPTFLRAYLALDDVLRAIRTPLRVRETYLSRLTKQQPDAYQGYLRLGQIYEESGRFQKAILAYQSTIQRYPSHTTALFLLAQLYERRRVWKKSIHYYRELLGYQPDEWGVRARLGTVFLKRGKRHDLKLARYQFRYIEREAVQMERPTRRLLIGRELFFRSRPKEAIVWLKRALMLKSDFSTALYLLGLSYRRLGQYEQADACFRKIPVSAKKHYFDAQIQRIELLVERQDLERARKILRQARAKFRVNPGHWSRLSQAFVERAPLVEVGRELQLLRPLLRRWPKHDGLLYHQAYLFFKQKKREACQQILLKLLKRNATHAPALNFLGYLYAQKGSRLKEAQELVGRALRLDPGNAYYLDSLGWILFRLGKLKRARRILEEVRWRLPREAAVLFHLAQVYRHIGRSKQALKLYRRVLILKPGASLLKKVREHMKQVLQTQSNAATSKRPATPSSSSHASSQPS